MTRVPDTRRRQLLPNARRGSDGKPLGSRCTEACRAPINSQAHCSVCHSTFRGPTDFDRHRVGGDCLELSELGLVEVDGMWASPDAHAQREMLAARMAETRRFPVAPVDADEFGGGGG